MSSILPIRKLYEKRNAQIPGFNSLISGSKLGTAQLPKRARRRVSGGEISYQLAQAVVGACCGDILSSTPVGFSNTTDLDGSVVVVKGSTGDYKIAYHIANNAIGSQHIRMYSKQLRQSQVSSHVGLLMLAVAFTYPKEYKDIINSYEALLDLLESTGGTLDPRNQNHVAAVALVSDELSVALEFGPNPVNIGPIVVELFGEDDPPNEVAQFSGEIPKETFMRKSAFTQYVESTATQNTTVKTTSTKKKKALVSKTPFMGSLANRVADDIMRGYSILLTGPTETGKTLLVESICDELGAPIFKQTGYEGLKDKDVIGAVRIADGDTIFLPGHLVRALEAGSKQYKLQVKENKQAAEEGREPNRVPPAVLYLDEFNRMETRYQNLFLAALNVRYGTKDFYLYVPETAEEITCPEGYFIIIAARNFGMHYVGTNDMDLACVRRFPRKYDVKYLPLVDEKVLVAKHTGIDIKYAEIMCRTADSIRMQSSELEAPLGTGSIIQWARAILERQEYGDTMSVQLMIDTARYTWFEMITGRDEWGQISDTNEKIVIDNINRSWKQVLKG